jgi:hypothetical protein
LLLFTFEQCCQAFGPLDIFLLRTFGTAHKQDDYLRTNLRLIEAPARAKIDAQLDYAVANRFEISQQAEREALNAFRNRAAHSAVFHAIKPRGELW